MSHAIHVRSTRQKTKLKHTETQCFVPFHIVTFEGEYIRQWDENYNLVDEWNTGMDVHRAVQVSNGRFLAICFDLKLRVFDCNTYDIENHECPLILRPRSFIDMSLMHGNLIIFTYATKLIGIYDIRNKLWHNIPKDPELRYVCSFGSDRVVLSSPHPDDGVTVYLLQVPTMELRAILIRLIFMFLPTNPIVVDETYILARTEDCGLLVWSEADVFEWPWKLFDRSDAEEVYLGALSRGRFLSHRTSAECVFIWDIAKKVCLLTCANHPFHFKIRDVLEVDPWILYVIGTQSVGTRDVMHCTEIMFDTNTKLPIRKAWEYELQSNHCVA